MEIPVLQSVCDNVATWETTTLNGQLMHANLFTTFC